MEQVYVSLINNDGVCQDCHDMLKGRFELLYNEVSMMRRLEVLAGGTE